MRILFMGTPDFAKTILASIYENGEEIVGVVTAEDKPKGRGMVLTPSEVKKYATEKNISVFQPKTLKDGKFEEVLRQLCPELIVVVAYGKILPKYVLDYPKHGCINAHASILPKYRGAAPIQRAIMAGEDKTGVSVMQMDEGLDTGDIILIEETPILEDDNFEAVHDKLAACGCKGINKAIELFKNGSVTRTKQGDFEGYAEKITKDDCHINFDNTLCSVHNQIRGLSPVPLAFCKMADGKILKVVKAHKTDLTKKGKAGEVVSLEKSIFVNCADGVIAIDEIIPEGKGKMKASDFINGRKINIGDILA